MSDDKPIESASADELAKTKKPGDVQLNEEELKQVSGGGALHNGTHFAKVIIELTRPTG
jgi:bacteriocin-like protein